jgi:hypothetical protein
MKGFTDVGGPRYIPSRYGMTETTHVFPTVAGGVGAIDWSGTFSSRVIEIVRWPKSNLSFLLAWEYDPGDGGYLDPPIDVMEYSEVAISITNMGNASVTGTLFETSSPLIFSSDVRGTGWSAMPAPLDVGPGKTLRLEFPTRGRSFLRVFLKRTEAQNPTTVNVVVSYD